MWPSYLLRHSWRIWYGESSPALLVSSYTLESSILIWLKYCGAEDMYMNSWLSWLNKTSGRTNWSVKPKRRRTSSSSPSTGFSSDVCFTKSGMRISSVARAEVHTEMEEWAMTTCKIITKVPQRRQTVLRRSNPPITMLGAVSKMKYQLYSWPVFYCLQFRCHK